MRMTRLAISVSLLSLFGLLFFAQYHASAQSVVDLVVHYIEAAPAEDESSYNVQVYLSVVDGTGLPIQDLKSDAFSIAEDSQKVDIANLGVVTDEPINIVLVMDTSGSMSGTGITDAKDAATAFIAGLKENDQVAILAFDNAPRTQIDFTADRKALSDRIALITATRDSNTCLYDAAYSAIQMASTLRSGSRAVILFTDGIDETLSGAICSVHTAEDVIALAKEDITRTPVYTLGMGYKTDANTLKRIADLTGGLYVFSPRSSQLANAFQLLSDQLRSQYILKYKSLAAQGPHTLTVSVNQLGMQDRDTRNFVLPALPTRIIFVTPLEGDNINDRLKVAVSLLGQGQIVQRVAFEVNGTEVGSDDTKPYELDLDATQFPAGALTIAAVAYGENNAEIARNTLNLVHNVVVEVPATAVPAELQPTPPPLAAPTPTADNSKPFGGIALGGLAVVIIAVLLFMLLRQQRQAKVLEAVDDSLMPVMQSIPIYSKPKEDRPASNWRVDSDALGALTIEASDDESLIGHHFEITSASIMLGRSADNDLNFPNDKPVSRHHAEIYQSNGKLYLRAVVTADVNGAPQPPKYGTFVNHLPLGSDSVLLNTGDEIQLGKRVRLKFEAYQKASEEEALTSDDMTSADQDLDQTADADRTEDADKTLYV